MPSRLVRPSSGRAQDTPTTRSSRLAQCLDLQLSWNRVPATRPVAIRMASRPWACALWSMAGMLHSGRVVVIPVHTRPPHKLPLQALLLPSYPSRSFHSGLCSVLSFKICAFPLLKSQQNVAKRVAPFAIPRSSFSARPRTGTAHNRSRTKWALSCACCHQCLCTGRLL